MPFDCCKDRIMTMDLRVCRKCRRGLCSSSEVHCNVCQEELNSCSICEGPLVVVRDHKQEIEDISKHIHYPDCWDTMTYPTLLDAIKEIYPGCYEDHE